jgi:tRNA synthetase B5 domain
MLVSLNEIKKLVEIPAEVSTEELVKLIGSRLVEVEGTIDLSKKYKGIKIVKVATCEDIPETHLRLCMIDAGMNELVQVVCGAPNVYAGMLAVWFAPGCIVPQTYGKENFELSVRKLRGYESNGMLAGLDEIDLGDDHSGIVEIDPNFAKAGDDFAEKFGLNDVILDIENKSLTHRPDTFGLIGFAREVAGILGVKFKESEVYSMEQFKIAKTGEKGISIVVEDEKLCPRYSVAAFEVLKTGLKSATEKEKYLTESDVFLAKAGMKKISKIVDATNITMLLTGQPLHAFDYDKFVKIGGTEEPKISVRAGRKGEKLVLISDKEIDLMESDIVICSNDVPVALAGAMGGKATEIDDKTSKVILESATFSLLNARKMQMAHGIFSEAITRFTKGQPVAGTVPALARCAKMLVGEKAELIDFKDVSKKTESIKIRLTVENVNELLGTEYTFEEMEKTLVNVGFKVVFLEETSEQGKGDDLDKADECKNSKGGDEVKTFEVIAPNWRTDVQNKEDVIEEIGRLRGYDNIPQSLPLRPFIGVKKNLMFELKRELRSILSDNLNCNEVLTYSFVSKELQEKMGEEFRDSYEIVNSISPELQCFRQSITPSLIDKMYENIRAGHKDFALYEFNQVTSKKLGLTEEQVPAMQNHLAMISTGDFYFAKMILTLMGEKMHVEFKLEENNVTEMPYFEKNRSAKVTVNGETVGVVGEIKNRVLRQFKVKKAAGFEMNLDEIVNVPREIVKNLKFSKFPFVERDLTFKVKSTLEFGELEKMIDGALAGLAEVVYKISPVSIYQGEDKQTKNISFHLSFASIVKTLGADEISDIMSRIKQKATDFGVKIV